MDRLWSPWRSEYVSDANQRATDGDGSLFSQLEKENADADNLILWRGEHVFVLMNLHPYTNGHLLIVPFREIERYDALTPDEQTAVAGAIDRCIRWLRHALSPDGFNVGMNLGRAAGAGIPEHLHVHVVPRWSGDTNFMPTTADAKVLPEDLSTTYRKLREAIEAVDASSPTTNDGSGPPSPSSSAP